MKPFQRKNTDAAESKGVGKAKTIRGCIWVPYFSELEEKWRETPGSNLKLTPFFQLQLLKNESHDKQKSMNILQLK
jgi:hypothetical protein